MAADEVEVGPVAVGVNFKVGLILTTIEKTKIKLIGHSHCHGYSGREKER